MTHNQKRVLKMNVELLEMLMKYNNDKNDLFYDMDVKEALLITICATNAVIRSLDKQNEQTYKLNTNENIHN
jgi:hypothetical protein